MIWTSVLERFEQYASASVMGQLVLEQALPAAGVDKVFKQHRQWGQYARALLFFTVIELMTLVSLGLRPLLYATTPARQKSKSCQSWT